MIKEYIRDGKIVPSEVTVKLLENAMHAALEEHKDKTAHGWGDGKGRFLVDGFPRKMDQAIIFDQTVGIFSKSNIVCMWSDHDHNSHRSANLSSSCSLHAQKK